MHHTLYSKKVSFAPNTSVFSQTIMNQNVRPICQLIVFYDGMCPLCHVTVRFLIDRDGYDKLRFASLQSEWTQAFFHQHGGDHSLQAVQVWNGTTWFSGMPAICEIAQHLPGIWRYVALLRQLPISLQEWIYTIVAKNRYRLFGKYDTCKIPTLAERGKFLDWQ
jgi:predicted DCC family thiol-disulfide oxidoreductase YuxK